MIDVVWKLREVARDPARPRVASALFFIDLVAVCVGALVGILPYWSGRVVLVLCPVLALCWFALPWTRTASRRRRAVSIAFAALVIAALTAVADPISLPLVLVLVANGVYVFGVRGGIVYAAALVVATFAAGFESPARPILFKALDAAVIGAYATLGVVVVAAVVHGQRLFAELDAAHAALRRSAERVRELTVAEERARMAREMHDSIGHHLTVIKVGLENAERFRERRPEQAWEEVRQAKELTQDALLEARRWVRALRPLSLDQALGTEAMSALADSFSGTGVDVRFSVSGCERTLDPDVELVLYRALQEGLTNALRHAAARLVTASLDFGEDRVALSVADDGVGATNTGRGFGLSSLGERARAAGGVLRTDTGAGSGFTLRVELPA